MGNMEGCTLRVQVVFGGAYAESIVDEHDVRMLSFRRGVTIKCGPCVGYQVKRRYYQSLVDRAPFSS